MSFMGLDRWYVPAVRSLGKFLINVICLLIFLPLGMSMKGDVQSVFLKGWVCTFLSWCCLIWGRLYIYTSRSVWRAEDEAVILKNFDQS